MGLLALLVSLAVAASAQVRYLVSNWVGDSVRILDSSGTNLGTLTGATLNGPQAQQIGPDGLLYVADELNNRIVRYGLTSGAMQDVIVASGLGGLNGPCGIAFDASGNMLVGSFNGDSVLKYSPTGAYLGQLVAPGAGGLNGPDVGMTVGPDGFLYIPSYWNGAILRCNANDGSGLATFIPGGSGLTGPRTLLWRGDDLLISSEDGDKVLRYDAETGAFLGDFIGAGSGSLNGAVGMAWDENDDLLVTSAVNNRLLRYDGETGAFLEIVADGADGLSAPTWVTVVPEPASLLVLLSAGALALRRRAK